MVMDANLKLTDREIESSFVNSQWAERFPPVLTIEQASELLQVPVATIRDWRSRGLLKSSCRRLGKRLRFFRNRLLAQVFNEGLVA